ncbi:hypothetical protein AYO44_06975 [Planctomycetaceae bacterium SCGC AG-212-F19]|nr:hypothetical protein AYO44_06975 [Planctomycetaceae bacterium SCGC AG-212-F19]
MPRGKKSKGSKVEFVKEAITGLGKDAMPLAIQKAVKEKHGVELPTSLISNYKHYLQGKKKGNGRRKVGRKPVARAHAANSSAAGITLKDIEAVKSLVSLMGAEKVKQLAQVLGK